ncbi:DnaJ-domain-containing protein [Aureobasidium pullulans]|uniref:DnaJ-domain-containing protein n=1 Tax=Aureobasidium pullulans TaxID=5580 RepID=A0A4S9LJG8_AURPU|nr:DnaJ-domain-containing protein [Aureobasidium pullulans]THX43085.1 DnaJ-domain-containing protein [Aureobasidium pullulans]THY08206.1 DnaJ-domain-containing protein [Aureobasidium pullulans]THY29194.1 DnaJ-domain-containing protein [Aureobasidium pullulans]THZ30222.1 DnaJ-domain-containing protein [Aureobasidium pullulans]
MILRPIQFRPVKGRPLPQLFFRKPLFQRSFHASPIRFDDGIPNHYATLGIDTTASAGDIKKQFFKMSKQHHPDRNPDDPKAADRFVKISEAYHVLGSAEKRARYDRDFLRANHPPSSHPQGSYSSTGPAGGRPATGLSRRRTQFKGPPPSFYRSGGYGSFSQKRSDAASTGSHQYEAAGASTDSSSAQDAPGTGPSGFQAGFNNDVPHFDREGHFRTHDNVMKNRHRSRRRTGGVSTDDILNNTSMLFNFVLLSGVLTVIFGVSGMLFRKTDEKKKL